MSLEILIKEKCQICLGNISHYEKIIAGISLKIAKEKAQLELYQIALGNKPAPVADNAVETFQREFPNGWTPEAPHKPKKPPFVKK